MFDFLIPVGVGMLVMPCLIWLFPWFFMDAQYERSFKKYFQLTAYMSITTVGILLLYLILPVLVVWVRGSFLIYTLFWLVAWIVSLKAHVAYLLDQENGNELMIIMIYVILHIGLFYMFGQLTQQSI